MRADLPEGTTRRPAPAWWAVVAAEVCAAATLRLAVLFRPLPVLDRVFVPDDTYYTLTIARSLAHGHGPTTDGHTLTSGFQPLLAFLMVPVYWVTDSADAALRADIAILVLCDVAVVVLLAWTAHRLAGPVAAMLAAGIWAVSPTAVRLAAGGLETSLLLLCEVGLVAVWMWAADRPGTRRAAIVGVVAALAVLARVDALGLVVLLGVVQLWRGHRRELVVTALTTVVVLAPWWGYCIARFGSPIPQSGAAERLIGAATATHGQALTAGSLYTLMGPFLTWYAPAERAIRESRLWPVVVTCVVLVGAAVTGVLATIRRDRAALTGSPDDGRHDDGRCDDGRVGHGGADDPALAGAAALFGLVLIGFYAWFALAWYTYRYVAPGAAVTAVVVACAIARAVDLPRFRVAGRVGAGATGVALLVLVAPRTSRLLGRELTATDHRFTPVTPFTPITGYRATAMEADHQTPPGARIGADQSGALSYFATQGRVVVNLDGVVNHDAEMARRHGTTGAYIEARHIHWVVDAPYFVIARAIEVTRHDRSAMVLPMKTFGPPDGIRLGVAELRYEDPTP